MRIGILGGGQLARMLIEAGTPLGHTFRIYSKEAEESTRGMAETHVGEYGDTERLARFADGLDVVTYEFENLNAAGVSFLESLLPVRPNATALKVGQDRAQEKALFVKLKIPTTEFTIVETQTELRELLEKREIPAVIKTTRMGYDGKGQCVVRSKDDIGKASALSTGPYIIENLVPFTREVSIIGVRALDGTMRVYPLTENVHQSGILIRSTAPAPGSGSTELQMKAEGYLKLAMEELDYYGVLAIEFFDCNGSLIANEMAPRVHNTGHWTIEGAAASQFENHLRAISGMPLGSTEPKGVSVMINLIGELPDTAPISKTPDTFLHLYGKSPRAGRKIGHVTLTGTGLNEILARARTLFPSAP